MTLHSQPISASAEKWSAQIAKRYHVRLSAELVRWFDDGLWKLEGKGEYREPIPPADLIETFPEAIWPGLMPPDFLPVLGNMAGDWLCMRLGPQGEVTEFVQWYHGGGDWLPWGKTLAEAIVFDAATQWLPGPSRRHAIPAEPMRLSADSMVDPLLAWALDQLPGKLGQRIRDVAGTGGADPELFTRELIASGIAEVAVQSEWVQRLLSDPSLTRLDTNLEAPRQLGVSRRQINEWLFDYDRIPGEHRERVLSQADSRPQQDWEAAAQHCRRVVEIAPHMAWGWDILGYASSRAGRYAEAAVHYAKGLTRSVFTDQSIRLRTHWTSPLAAKFSAAMLSQLFAAGHVTAADIAGEFDPEYLAALCADEDSRQELVTEYWLGRSDRSSLAGNHAVAFDEAYAAGWDLGAATLPAYGSVLDRLVEIADSCGDAARAELARTHRRCLSDRLGI